MRITRTTPETTVYPGMQGWIRRGHRYGNYFRIANKSSTMSCIHR
jgi:hypothetical protein